MKKILSIICLVISCVIFIASVGFYIYSVNDIERTYYELANTPGVSGIDYLGMGWAYGIGLFMLLAVCLFYS